MTEKKVKSILHDATPSWNGYNYQGKIGLYVCLTNILNEAQKGIDLPSFEVFLNEHHIEYEWIEDFAIKRNETYLSLHQVKNKAQNNFSEHVEAIATILNRNNGVLPDTDLFKYFAFVSKKKDDVLAEKKAIKNEIFTHRLIDDNGSLDSNWKDKISAVDVKYSNNIGKCFNDFEMLSENAFGFSSIYFHTVDNVPSPSKDISQYSGIPSQFVDNLTSSKSLSCQQIFLSFDRQFEYKLALSDNELNKQLDNLISDLLNLIHPHTTFSIEDKKPYKPALCALIDQNIVTRHKHLRDKKDAHLPYFQRTKPSISFIKILQELEKTYRVQDSLYWNLICRENFEAAYTEQLDELNDDINNATCDKKILLYQKFKIRLEYVRNHILGQYLPDNCILFLKQINPHEIKDTNERQYYEAISKQDKMKSVFFDFIQEIIKRSGKFTLKCKKGVNEFQPTCIDLHHSNDRRWEKELNKVKKGLVENDNKSLINPNVDYLVINSTDCNYRKSTGIEKITDVEPYGDIQKNVNEHKNIVKKKEVFFIDSRKALGEING